MATVEREAPRSLSEQSRLGFTGQAVLVSGGWFGTNLGLAIGEFCLRFVLKDGLHLSPQGVSGFFFIGQFLNYFKPLAGVLTDSFPLFRTRRRAYLLLSLIATGVGWLLLGSVPREYGIMLLVYTFTYTNVVFTSTTLGGVMVEVGMRFRAEGRLTAQRIGMFKLGALAGGPVGGILASYPFMVSASAAGAFHLLLVPLFAWLMPERRDAKRNFSPWIETKRQARALLESRVLLSAAGMVILIAIAPGLHTPLFFYQTNVLKFTPADVGILSLIGNSCGLLAAAFYHSACRRIELRTLIVASIIVHAGGTLAYYYYKDWHMAMLIAGLEGITETLAMLPVYDMAARCTPRGSEALGYSVMMSVWNLTNKLSDWIGSYLYGHFNVTFTSLIWLNSGTTLIALIAVPFLPLALMCRRDGHVEPKTSPT
jgi:Na+/melibiose symporter-like transporter